MNNSPYLLNDFYQDKSYGGESIENKDFSCRFIIKRYLFYKSLYVPYGPVIKSFDKLDLFFEYLDANLKFTNIKIDTPLLLNSYERSKLIERFKKYNFKKSDYIQDAETLILSPKNYSLNSRNMRYVRKGDKKFNFEIRNSFKHDEGRTIYNVYVESARIAGFKPKSFESLFASLQDSHTIILIDKENGSSIEGFLNGRISYLGIEEPKRILQLIFTGLSAKARDYKAGFMMHYRLFNYIFDNNLVDLVDFHGATRSRKSSFIKFKMSFGGEFVELPGSFKKLIIL